MEYAHHIVSKNRRGSGTFADMVGLRVKCRALVHMDVEKAETLAEGKKGLVKKIRRALRAESGGATHCLRAQRDVWKGSVS